MFQLLAWVGIATATWLVGLALGLDHGWATVTLATCTSWVAGFLFLPVPGGIGIRESAFLAVLGADPDVAAMALAARLLFVAVDALGATISTAAVKGAARRDTASHTTVSPGSNDAA